MNLSCVFKLYGVQLIVSGEYTCAGRTSEQTQAGVLPDPPDDAELVIKNVSAPSGSMADLTELVASLYERHIGPTGLSTYVALEDTVRDEVFARLAGRSR